MESSRQTRIQAVVLTAFALATAAETLAVLHGSWPSARQAFAAAILTSFVAACRLFPLHIGYKRKMLTDSAPLLAAALLLPPWMAGVVAGGGMALAEAWGARNISRTFRQVVFNSSQRMLSALGASAVFVLLAGSNLSEPDLSTGLAAAAAIVVAFVINDVLLLGVITAQLGRSVVSDWFRDRGDVPYDVALYASGLVFAFLGNDHVWFLLLLALPVAVFHRAMRDQVALRVQTRDAVEALADVVDMRDPYTFDHSKRVAEFSRGICRELGFSVDVTDEIVAAARVHDVGKVGVRDAVLLKAGRLEDDERKEIQEHPELGARLTARFPDFGRGTEAIRHHHEKWDGTGYPLGLRGTQIPVGARVIAVADTYDAMTSSRVYRAALSDEVTRNEMARVAGTQLDPIIVKAFFRSKGWEPLEEAAVPSPLTIEHNRMAV